MKLKVLNIAALCLISFGFNACSQKEPSYFTSQNKVKEINKTKNEILTNDIVSFIEKFYPAASTNFLMNINKDSNDEEFTSMLENKLRSKGYAVSYKFIDGVLPFAWKIDLFNPKTLRATYLISDKNINKLYSISNDTLSAITPFTVLNLDKLTPLNVKPKIEVKVEAEEIKNVVYEPYKAKVFARSLNIRKEPSIKSKVIGGLKKNDYVTIEYETINEFGSSWSKLLYVEGYVSSRYLRTKGK